MAREGLSFETLDGETRFDGTPIISIVTSDSDLMSLMESAELFAAPNYEQKRVYAQRLTNSYNSPTQLVFTEDVQVVFANGFAALCQKSWHPVTISELVRAVQQLHLDFLPTAQLALELEAVAVQYQDSGFLRLASMRGKVYIIPTSVFAQQVMLSASSFYITMLEELDPHI